MEGVEKTLTLVEGNLSLRLANSPTGGETSDQTTETCSQTCEAHRYNPELAGYFREAEHCELCARYEAQNRIRACEQKFHDMGVGERFWGYQWRDYQPVCEQAAHHRDMLKNYAENFAQALQNGTNGILMGNYGTGKNMLAALVCKTLANSGHTALHTTTAWLIRRIRDSWRRDSMESETSIYLALREPELLVIDEVGVQSGSQNEINILTGIVNDRYERKRPVLLISNLDLAGMTKLLGERIIERFYDGGSFLLTFDWPSYRRRACNGGQ